MVRKTNMEVDPRIRLIDSLSEQASVTDYQEVFEALVAELMDLVKEGVVSDDLKKRARGVRRKAKKILVWADNKLGYLEGKEYENWLDVTNKIKDLLEKVQGKRSRY